MDKKIVKGIEIIVVIIIVAIIGKRFRLFVSWLIAAAVPVLVFCISLSVKMEISRTKVFIEPKRMRNCSFVRSVNCDAVIAA